MQICKECHSHKIETEAESISYCTNCGGTDIIETEQPRQWEMYCPHCDWIFEKTAAKWTEAELINNGAKIKDGKIVMLCRDCEAKEEE